MIYKKAILLYMQSFEFQALNANTFFASRQSKFIIARTKNHRVGIHRHSPIFLLLTKLPFLSLNANIANFHHS